MGFNPSEGWESRVGFNPRDGDKVLPKVVWTGLTLEMCVILLTYQSRSKSWYCTRGGKYRHHHHVDASLEEVGTKAREHATTAAL